MTAGASTSTLSTRPRTRMAGRRLVDVSASLPPEAWRADLEAAFGQASSLHQHVPVLEASRTALDRFVTRLARR